MEKIEDLLQKTGVFHQKYLDRGIDVLIDCLQSGEYLGLLDAIGALSLTDLPKSVQDLETQIGPKDLVTVSLFWNDYVGIGLLLLGEEAEMPCHDHPAMTVTTKVLKGEIQQTNFDIVDLREQFDLARVPSRGCCCGVGEPSPRARESDRMIAEKPAPRMIEAKVTTIETLRENDIFNLTPVAHNLHKFQARQRTVLLKVLIPNYDSQFRFCNFYKVPEPLVAFPGAKVFLEYPSDVECPIRYLTLKNSEDLQEQPNNNKEETS